MRSSRLIWLALLLLTACAPGVPEVPLSAQVAAKIEAALLRDFWDGDKPHSACTFHALAREGERFYVYTNCQHWAPQGNALQLSSGGSGPAVVTLGATVSVKHPRDGSFFAKDVRELFPTAVQPVALRQGPQDFYNSLSAATEVKAKAAP